MPGCEQLLLRRVQPLACRPLPHTIPCLGQVMGTDCCAMLRSCSLLRLQAAFGRNGLAVSSFLTYLGLGFSLLGSSLAWPFGIYLLLCQRESER